MRHHIVNGTVNPLSVIPGFDILKDCPSGFYRVWKVLRRNEAYKASVEKHKEWLSVFPDEDAYIQVHGKYGSEIQEKYGIDERSMVSVTTDEKIAREIFVSGEGGIVYYGNVPKSQLIEQTLSGTGEKEFLIKQWLEDFKDANRRINL